MLDYYGYTCYLQQDNDFAFTKIESTLKLKIIVHYKKYNRTIRNSEVPKILNLYTEPY